MRFTHWDCTLNGNVLELFLNQCFTWIVKSGESQTLKKMCSYPQETISVVNLTKGISNYINFFAFYKAIMCLNLK